MDTQSLRDLYDEKNSLLSASYEELEAYEFYRELFPGGFLEREDHPEDNKPNAMAIQITVQDGKRSVSRCMVHDDLKYIREAKGASLALMAPLSYYGRSNTLNNARYLHAMAVDLDGITMKELETVISFSDADVFPTPTYIVNSGTGLHLYYAFDKPIPMYPKNRNFLQLLKRLIIKSIWVVGVTSTIEKPQMQGINQGFRIIGSASKLGADCPVRAYRFSNRLYTMGRLVEYVSNDLREKKLLLAPNLGKISLEEAKEKYPEWYKRRILDKRPSRQWTVSRNLYDWWKRKISDPDTARIGHRYFCIMALAIFAKKCGIGRTELERDAREVRGILDTDSKNPFTKEDVTAALRAYDRADASMFRRDTIQALTAVQMPVNKRNYRKQETHIKIASAVRDILYPDGEWRNREGAPTKKKLVQAYASAHPDANHSEIARALDISRSTVIKWLK